MAFFFCNQNKVYAQEEAEFFTAKNLVFAELGGKAIYSVGFSRVLYQKERFKLSGSTGFSMWYYDTSKPFFESSHWLPDIPIEIIAFWGKSRHNLEIGTGITAILRPQLMFDPNTSKRIEDQFLWDATVLVRLGYRYQKPEGGFFFRIAYTPGAYFIKTLWTFIQ